MRRFRYWPHTGLPVIAGGAEEEPEETEGDEEVNEDELPAGVKSVLKKERKARRDAEKAQRAAEREASRDRSDLQKQISDLEARIEAPKDEPGDNAELETLKKRITELETELETANKSVEDGQAAVRTAKLTAELRNPEYGIADDAVDLVTGQLEVEYNDSGDPTGVKDAVDELLEQRPSLKRREEGQLAGVTAGNPDSGRTRGGQMTKDEAKQLAQSNPDEFNKRFEAGDIPANALGG